MMKIQSAIRGNYRDVAPILELVNKYLEEKVFSHIYLAVGSLCEKDPLVQINHLPGNRVFFDLASLTKALVIVPMVFEEVLNGRLNLDMTIREWLQRRASVFSDDISRLTVHSLISHTSSLPAWRNLWVNSINEDDFCRKERALAKINSCFRKDETQDRKYVYSDLGYILLGVCLEELYQIDLSTLFYQFCSRSLNILDSPLFFPSKFQKKEQFIPSSYCKVRRKWLVGTVHDENAFSLDGISGHAGLFGSGKGLIAYLKKLMSSPIGRRILKENTLDAKQNKTKGLCGWESFEWAPKHTLGHLGFTGTAFLIDPQHNNYYIILTNRVISSRISQKMPSFRENIALYLSRIITEEYNA